MTSYNPGRRTDFLTYLGLLAKEPFFWLAVLLAVVAVLMEHGG